MTRDLKKQSKDYKEGYMNGYSKAKRKYKKLSDFNRLAAFEACWNPIITREPTDEEREENPDWTFMYDCKMPDDGEEVLVTTMYGDVRLDVWCNDSAGAYFETYCDDDEVLAWAHLPKPYEGLTEER